MNRNSSQGDLSMSVPRLRVIEKGSTMSCLVLWSIALLQAANYPSTNRNATSEGVHTMGIQEHRRPSLDCSSRAPP